MHCASLRDALYVTKHMLKPDTSKKLANINAAHSAHRHETSVSAVELLQKVETELTDYLVEHTVPEHKNAVETSGPRRLPQAQEPEHKAPLVDRLPYFALPSVGPSLPRYAICGDSTKSDDSPCNQLSDIIQMLKEIEGRNKALKHALKNHDFSRAPPG